MTALTIWPAQPGAAKLWWRAHRERQKANAKTNTKANTYTKAKTKMKKKNAEAMRDVHQGELTSDNELSCALRRVFRIAHEALVHPAILSVHGRYLQHLQHFAGEEIKSGTLVERLTIFCPHDAVDRLPADSATHVGSAPNVHDLDVGLDSSNERYADEQIRLSSLLAG